MPKRLQSGRRRDVCAILADAGQATGQRPKTRLEAHYDERIDPRSFYGALSALEDAGFVEKRTEGIADVYSLSDAGETRLREHFEWLRANLEDRTTADE
jgi:DNA-binding PadR family transcriptional regulator